METLSIFIDFIHIVTLAVAHYGNRKGNVICAKRGYCMPADGSLRLVDYLYI